MNKQQLFDIAYTGLAKQGFQRSMSPDDPALCAYRGLNGLKCAIGHAIPDEKYQPDMESVWTLEGILELIGASDLDSFAHVLRKAHDGADTPQEMKARLLDFAKNWGLYIPTLESLI